jgi:hypothetical protein
MREGKISIFETDEHLEELSGALHRQLVPDFSDYGLAMERFFVTTIAKPDGDRAYERFKEIHLRQYADVAEAQIRQKVGVIEQQTEAQRMVIEADALAEKRKLEGFTYQQQRGFEVAEQLAKNEGVGNFSNMGIGLGMMGGVAAGMGSTVAGITAGAMAAAGNLVPPAQETGNGINAFKQKVEKLKALKEADMLSDEEFELERKKLLDSL